MAAKQDSPNKFWVLAILLAWAVPGLGHWYLGRRSKAVVFFVFVLGLFVVGLGLGGWKVVDHDNLLFFGQVLIGFASFVADNMGSVLRVGSGAPSPVPVSFEMSQLYTLVAGLLNLLTILDAYLVANNIRRTAVGKGV